MILHYERRPADVSPLLSLPPPPPRSGGSESSFSSDLAVVQNHRSAEASSVGAGERLTLQTDATRRKNCLVPVQKPTLHRHEAGGGDSDDWVLLWLPNVERRSSSLETT